MWLEIDTGGPEPAEVTERRYVPDYLMPTLRAAGADLPSLDLVPVAELRAIIRHSAMRVRSLPDLFATGDVGPDGCDMTLRRCLELLDALTFDCAAHPMATFRVSVEEAPMGHKQRMRLTTKLGLVFDMILLVGAVILTIKTFKTADGVSFEDVHGLLLIALALFLGAATLVSERREMRRQRERASLADK